ncbi:TPA: helix-turn-helix domain-containing protein [Staphylococcus aureus]
MNDFKEVYVTIKKLLDSDITAYQIEKRTGVSRAKIGRLKNDKNSLKNLTLETAEKLYNYQKELEKMNKD